MSSINQRINELIGRLGQSTQGFATSIGFSKSTIYNVVGPRASKPSSEIVSAILSTHPQVRPEWLLNGEGLMLREAGQSTGEVNEPGMTYTANRQPAIKPAGPAITVPEFDNDLVSVKWVDTPATASYLSGFPDTEFVRSLPTLKLPAMGVGSRELYAFPIQGDSMLDRFSNGDIILAQKVEPEDALRWGEVYVLLLNDGLVVKELRKGTNSKLFTLHSFNPHFEPYEVQRSEMRAMFRYQASISFNSSNPNRGAIMRFLTALSEQLTDIKETITNPEK